MSGAQVRLNVYDMYWLNEYASNIGFGIFHSGIEVFGVEYAFGGHPYQFSGVFESSPQDAEELGENFKFKESIVLGYTDFTREDIRDLIKSVGSQFRGDRYHLINRNCNHFSAELAKLLTGKEIPTWVNRLANISGSIPFLEKCLPQEWLTPVALQESLNHPSPKPATRDAARNASTARDASTATRITWRRKSSIDEAEEATESIGRRLNALNGRQDSRTTVLSGVAGDMTSSSSASSTTSEDGGRASPPSTYSRLWNQIKSSVGANETLRN